jgi:hypothetical protein
VFYIFYFVAGLNKSLLIIKNNHIGFLTVCDLYWGFCLTKLLPFFWNNELSLLYSMKPCTKLFLASTNYFLV